MKESDLTAEREAQGRIVKALAEIFIAELKHSPIVSFDELGTKIWEMRQIIKKLKSAPSLEEADLVLELKNELIAKLDPEHQDSFVSIMRPLDYIFEQAGFFRNLKIEGKEFRSSSK